MKHSLRAVVALILLLALCAATGCGDFLDSLLEEMKNTPDATETAADETPRPRRIPFRTEPDVPAYELPAENYADALEEEAAALCDNAIAKAIAYVGVMKDERHSHVSFAFDPDANGYLSALTKEERELFDSVVQNARSGSAVTVKEKEFAGSLRNAFFALYTPLSYCEPGVASYTDLTTDTTIDAVTMESRYRSVSSFFFDPYRDQNSTVSSGEITDEQVLHDAALLQRIAARVVRFMPENLSAYDQYYYLAAFLSEQVSYDDRPKNCYTAFGALVCGKAVCEGYATAYYLLCREANLWCAYRTGRPDGGSHIWNMVKLENGVYNVDVTWCDNDVEPHRYRWYRSFICSDQAFEENGHNASGGVAGTGAWEPNPYEEKD